MKRLERFLNRLKGFTDAVGRFPLSVAFLLAAAIINAIAIENWTDDYYKPLMVFCVGAVFAAVGQVVYERFFDRLSVRFGLMAAGAVLAGAYYLVIGTAPDVRLEVWVKTSVIVFAFLIGFIWVPSIKSKTSFNESFLATFKAFFIAVFFSSVMFLGVSLIIMATDQLLFRVDENAHAHAANIIYLLFATIYFLSLTPHYPGVKEKGASQDEAKRHEEELARAVSCPKYLEILISYIIIPITAVFTVILLIYIIMNISGSFWSDNLLEPMLVAYAITVIVVYLLASNLSNKAVILFRKIFPKVLLPIVLFQTVASVLKIGDMGVTHGRYYVIMFGVFAVIAGVVFSFLPIGKNGIIAIVLIVLSTISIIPPMDAFTVAYANQMTLLENTLVKTGMLKDGAVTPDATISSEDKTKIIKSFQYLRQMDYLDKIEWMEGKDAYIDFRDVFGFEEYETDHEGGKYLSFFIEEGAALELEGYDRLVLTNIGTYSQDEKEMEICSFEEDGMNYSVTKAVADGRGIITLKDETGNEIVSQDTDGIVERFVGYGGSGGVPVEDMTFISESEEAEIRLVLRYLNIDTYQERQTYDMEIFVFIRVK